jgi:putative ABC transport system permease protein
VIGVALKGLAGRKFRAVLTSLAIVLGVAMISGAYVLTDTIDKAFDAIFVDSYAGTDAVVSGREVGISFEGESAATPPVSESLVETVRGVDGIEVAVGTVFDDRARLIKPDGDAIETGGAPSLGFGIDTSPKFERFNPLNLLEGRWPAAEGEVVIDVGTASDEEFAVGETIGVAGIGPARDFEIVGIARYGDVASLGSVTFALFDIPTAQRLFGKPGQIDAIQVAAEVGVGPEELVQRISRAIPPTASVQTGAEQAADDSDEIATFTSIIRYFLLAFAAIALFVGAFVIFNTLSITVAQRTREFATLRTIGASRWQVLAAVILEAFAIGLIASIIGLFLGLGLAVGLNELFVALNLDLPQTDTVFALRTVIVSLIVGVFVTVLAGLAPAIRATRVPPIAAVREGIELPRSALSRFAPYIAAVTVVIAVVALAYSMLSDDMATGSRFLLMGVGCLALFIGVALLSPRLVKPLARVVGLPARRAGGAAGRLAERNAQRNPGRTAATAAALMIGIALVTFVAVLAQGVRVSNLDAIERQIGSDYVITSQDGYSEFVAAAGDAVADVEGMELVTQIRQELGEVAGSGKNVTGLEPATATEAYNFRWENGSDDVIGELGSAGAIMPSNVAEDENITVGDRVAVRSIDNRTRTFVVKGIYEGTPFYPLLGSISISQQAFDSLYDRPRNRFTLVNVPGGPTEAQKTRIEGSLTAFPDTRVFTRQEWIDKEEREINQFLSLLYVLLALSVIISLFGMVNTLVLSVFERTRELGMLRAVGMTRRQVRRMVRHESVITALIGAALGLPLGIFLAALATQALSQYELQFSIPLSSLILFTIVAILAGIVAAILPARRAARLDVLQALQYE